MCNIFVTIDTYIVFLIHMNQLVWFPRFPNALVGGGCDHLSKTCQGIIEIEVPIKGHSFVACFFSFTFCHKKCLQQCYLESQTQQIDVNAVPTQKHIHLLVYAKHNEPTVNMNVVGCI
mmetsp:Transcript_25882/g.34357  ORF Transcript_25882/g.34357 Transcript_25882/m.34357 type:complete len:118 (+) Transcript_25882:3078-3431(+)